MVDVRDRTRPVRVWMGELEARPRELEPPGDVPAWYEVELDGMGRPGVDVDVDVDEDEEGNDDGEGVDDVSPELF